MNFDSIKQRILRLADRDKAQILRGFFKTGPGQYGEGDIFLGVTVPVLRKLAKECKKTSAADAFRLLRSSIHEERLLALFLLIERYRKGDDSQKKEIYEGYLKSTRYINNWDLVDLSAPNIVGNYLSGRSRKPLYDLARSSSLWDRRIAILATFSFIRQNQFSETIKIAKILISDEHDLIHKAVGWMLREVGKRNLSIEEEYLLAHYRKMPRTMLRYAIERFPEDRRKQYLASSV
ncbi:MAG: DNA alkylation repair protein [Nitrospirae bacterium GWD2_57_9]|nr:MAG: DNA alkylation repair protein [Nitrospirae bacterium GWD2_57_9]OGW45147.1 MAG: DNA alkylation repair protein [Nitrospirae bacterium GWC2_57_9]